MPESGRRKAGFELAPKSTLRQLCVRPSLASDHSVAKKLSNPPSIELALPKQALTMREANALLASAPSYKAAVDSMAFHNQGSFPKDKQSALAVLAKEKIKL